MIRALVVDDTTLFRNVVSEALGRMPDLRVVGTAPNGKIALSKIYTLLPDIVTLDIEMPVMNGIEVLEALREKGLASRVVVVSSLTRRGGELTMRALELGAFDFVTKPEGGERALADFERVLASIVTSMRRSQEVREILKGLPQAAARQAIAPVASANGPGEGIRLRRIDKSEIVAIGISTGGPQALLSMMPSIPAGFPAPITIVQHMPPLFTATLAKSLSARCAIPVVEAQDGEDLRPGTAYLAPGGRQMKVALTADAKTKILRVTDDPPENNCRPSVDYLFRSVAHLFFGKATAVIMTGMGSDGLTGAEALRKADAIILAQDEASCVVYGMPKAVVDSSLADSILPLGSIAGAIARSVGSGG
jgi:Chemotaxis response regulator containing a CheY-like receiver domain and a methylesterase domain